MSGSLDIYTKNIQKKMTSMFERQMNIIINEFQDKLREALVDVATGYTCEIATVTDDYSNERRVVVEVRWPNDETKDGNDEMESIVYEGEKRQDQT